MLDIQFIRDNPEAVKTKSKQKGYQVDIDKLLETDSLRREKLAEIETLRAQRNQQSDLTKNQRPDENQIEKGRQLKEKLSKLESDQKELDEKYFELLKQVPNMPLDDVPVGSSE